MYVESLELTNFKSIKKKTLKLSKCNVIYGAPATGKTSIILSLAYAFGLNAFEERIVDYVRDGESEFSIKMKARHKLKSLDMSIKAGEKGTKKELVYDGEEFSNSNVVEKLKDLYSPDLVLYSSIALQDQTSSVLFEAPSERLNRLKSLLGMDEISEASERMSADVQSLKSKISTLKVEISALETSKFEKMEVPDYPHLEENLQEEFNLMKIKHETYLTELRDYENKLEDERKRKANFDKQLQAFKFYVSQKAELITKVEKLNNRLLEYKPKLKDSIDVTSLDKELSVTRSDYQTQANKLKFAKLGKCSECGREFKGDLKSLENLCESLKEKGIALKLQKEEADKTNQEILKFQTLYKSEKSNLESVESELNSLAETFDPGEFSPVAYEKPEFDSNKYDNLKAKIAVHNQKIQEINRAVEFNAKQLQKEQQNSQEILDKKNSLVNLSGELSILEEGKSILDKEFTPFLLEGGLSFVEEEMNNFFTRVHSHYRVHMKKDKKSVSFFYSKRKDHLAPIGTLSGHERKIMSVAFRVALTAMQDFGIMVMDEIDGSADDERSLSLFKNLMELDFEQIFIVSHKSATVRYLVNECDATLINMNEENFV